MTVEKKEGCDVSVESHQQPRDQQRCQKCGCEFTARRWWSKFCTTDCRNAFNYQVRRDAYVEYRAFRSPLSTGMST